MLVDLNDRMCILDVVAVFKLFAGAYPLVKIFHTTTTSLRRRRAAVHTSLRLLW